MASCAKLQKGRRRRDLSRLALCGIFLIGSVGAGSRQNNGGGAAGNAAIDRGARLLDRASVENE